ncbi:MAG: hypothetical protein GAK34_00933 [Delftia tsuruhatensis]|nr:MAG: hypothetical protein GAK34_00933 [Delftia tsuruhatensis]
MGRAHPHIARCGCPLGLQHLQLSPGARKLLGQIGCLFRIRLEGRADILQAHRAPGYVAQAAADLAQEARPVVTRPRHGLRKGVHVVGRCIHAKGDHLADAGISHGGLELVPGVGHALGAGIQPVRRLVRPLSQGALQRLRETGQKVLRHDLAGLQHLGEPLLCHTQGLSADQRRLRDMSQFLAEVRRAYRPLAHQVEYGCQRGIALLHGKAHGRVGRGNPREDGLHLRALQRRTSRLGGEVGVGLAGGIELQAQPIGQGRDIGQFLRALAAGGKVQPCTQILCLGTGRVERLSHLGRRTRHFQHGIGAACNLAHGSRQALDIDAGTRRHKRRVR